ncbi:hypothetical protein A197_00118 [Escherichia coli KTE236]|nr:hypothetical protein A197_00118 [Escherichia coli KTE236]ELD90379.1 hypothetical protein A199_01058 [Escherichia coli KTE237]EOV30440.1 hypothetical protein A159_00131 [Escherichia coli KTE199]EOW36123.1 hypothetical protein A1Y9_00119 [Escherichia coli KTE121]SYX53688.1 Uncharacterised protein [Escherichia coli]
MHSQLKERIRLMRARLDNAAPVAEIRAESQLFVTPAPVCDRLVTLAEISNRDHILEPSAGTGPYCGRFVMSRRGPCVMRWRLTAGWSGICGIILTVSGFSVATSWNGSRCSITAGLS